MDEFRAGVALEALAQHLECLICFDVFLDPVTASCGKHNYCKRCLSTFCEGQGRRNCPQCMESRRRDYTPQKNVTLCEIVEVLGRGIWEDLLAKGKENRDSVRLGRHSMDNQTQEFLTGQVTECAGLYEEEAATSQHNITPLSVVRELSKGVAASEPHEECGSSFENSELTFNGAQSVTDIADAGAQWAESSDSQSETFARLTFNPELRHSSLAISEDGRRVEVRKPRGMSRFRQERFETSQVMADPEFVCGAHYWDVDVASAEGWAIGVSYSSLGSGDFLGRTAASWCLEWSSKKLRYWHDSVPKLLGHDHPSKVRVVLDMDEGSLSFYSLCDRKTLLHSSQVTFTAPVRSAFWLYGLGNRNSLSFTGP